MRIWKIWMVYMINDKMIYSIVNVMFLEFYSIYCHNLFLYYSFFFFNLRTEKLEYQIESKIRLLRIAFLELGF